LNKKTAIHATFLYAVKFCLFIVAFSAWYDIHVDKGVFSFLRLEMKTKLDLIKRTYPAAFSAPTDSTGLSDSDVPSSLSSEMVESNVELLWDNLWQSLLHKKNSLLLVLQRYCVDRSQMQENFIAMLCVRANCFCKIIETKKSSGSRKNGKGRQRCLRAGS